MVEGCPGASATRDQALAQCRAVNGPANTFHATSGLSWFLGTLSHTMYNHDFTPNAVNPDCILRPASPISGFVTARSRHPGGVNVAFGDGSVHFMKDSVDAGVWTAVGTRAGNEVATPEL
jgi:prepilin-type processing-associated H-X9-DG protein